MDTVSRGLRKFSADPFGLNDLLCPPPGGLKKPVEEELGNRVRLCHTPGVSPVGYCSDEMIRVGRAMGYSMEGCEKDIESIINSKGDEAYEDMDFVQNAKVRWAIEGDEELEMFFVVFRVIQAVSGDKIDSQSVRKKKNLDGDIPLCELCPRLFALDSAPNICVAAKMAGPLDTSFRRSVRGGVEQQEFSDLSSFLNSVVLSTSNDRWYFSLSSSGEFSVKDTRLAIDDLVLPSHSEPTRWVKLIPIKINVFMWRARRGCLPTRYNLVQKGVILESTSCPVCFSDEEDVHHLLFRCSLSQEVLHRVCRWWEIDFQLWRSFSEWDEWFSSIRLPGSVKGFLEGVFYVAWWFIWGFRNRSTFDVNKPSRSILFENIVSSSFLWCNSRCSRKFSRDDWLKNPHLISL
ncbi:RNA-directed DNA polymerase, eukaryota [Tanacetum coccineum]